MTIHANDIITYREMCDREGVQTLQRGMNFQMNPPCSVILMSRTPNAPYVDEIMEEGRVIVYEGHDIPRTSRTKHPKSVDQPQYTPNGKLTQNGLFHKAAQEFRNKRAKPCSVRVYEKIRPGVWAYNGIFYLVDSWIQDGKKRRVFKFRLEATEKSESETKQRHLNLEHTRVIPSSIKAEVWKRDKGKCCECDAVDNLHFDHIIPFSKGGSSLVAVNIRILCARHNLQKRDKIE